MRAVPAETPEAGWSCLNFEGAADCADAHGETLPTSTDGLAELLQETRTELRQLRSEVARLHSAERIVAFTRYEQSSRARGYDDSSVSYASAVVSLAP